MPNPSFSIDDELLEEFDRTIWAKKVAGDLDKDTSRSEVIQDLIEDYVEGNANTSTPSRTKATPAVSD